MAGSRVSAAAGYVLELAEWDERSGAEGTAELAVMERAAGGLSSAVKTPKPQLSSG